jgi:Lrp/AsnC family transcriptional regulator for asnA, asnC and gidA
VHLDDTAKAIVQQLQIDGRRSYSEIGKAVGLSEAAVRQRVQKLTDSGVLQVVAVTDPLQMEPAVTHVRWLKCSPKCVRLTMWF